MSAPARPPEGDAPSHGEDVAQRQEGAPVRQRLAWAITGSGHFLRECLEIIDEIGDVDLFLSAAAAEVLGMYGHNVSELKTRVKVFRDNTASSVPVEFFYQGHYHTVVIAPATSNTIAKMVWGISDTLVTNIYAQAGKCRVPAIVFACDTEPELESEAPDGTVKVYPRRIDLDNAERLKSFEATTVVPDMAALRQALDERLRWLSTSSS
jgi:dihydromethanopterin reductase (acceptor)